jgi:predicted amidophosphoribosyltransferase
VSESFRSNPGDGGSTEGTSQRSRPVSGTGPLCPGCGRQNRQGSQFCAHCGEPLGRYCHQCGQAIPPDLELCDRCSPDTLSLANLAGRCQTCGEQNDVEAERCVKCGARLLINCARCGSPQPASFNFCPRCGFEQSRLVTDRLLGGIDREQHEEPSRQARPRLSWALMAALMVLSVALMVQILLQIAAT